MEVISETGTSQTEKSMNLHFTSFGFKHGIPEDVNYVFDVRVLPNPFYVPEMKELTGIHKCVRDFVMESDVSKELEKQIISLIETVVPECLNKNRNQLVIAIGCTGGHHRSVTFAERLYSHFKEKNYNISVSHRDINK